MTMWPLRPKTPVQGAIILKQLRKHWDAAISNEM